MGGVRVRPPDHVVEAGHDAYEAKARELGYVSGSPVPWSEVPEPYRSCTIAGYEAALGALVRDPETRERIADVLWEIYDAADFASTKVAAQAADAVLGALFPEEDAEVEVPTPEQVEDFLAKYRGAEAPERPTEAHDLMPGINPRRTRR